MNPPRQAKRPDRVIRKNAHRHKARDLSSPTVVKHALKGVASRRLRQIGPHAISAAP